MVGKETGFDLDSALRRVLTYFDQWKGNAAEPIENIGINDEKIIRHLNQDIVQDRISSILSVQIKNFPNEAGYFMLWELSLTESDRQIIPIFVNDGFILRPIAGKRIFEVFLDPSSQLVVKCIPNIEAETYEQLEAMSKEYSYKTFVDMRDKHLRKNQESYNKYMYALGLRTEAAKQIGIENIRLSRLARLHDEEEKIERAYIEGKKVLPEFRLVLLVKLEA